MRIEKIRIGISELRKTENYENRRFTIELEAAVEKGEKPLTVEKDLIKKARDAVNKFFEETPKREYEIRGGFFSNW